MSVNIRDITSISFGKPPVKWVDNATKLNADNLNTMSDSIKTIKLWIDSNRTILNSNFDTIQSLDGRISTNSGNILKNSNSIQTHASYFPSSVSKTNQLVVSSALNNYCTSTDFKSLKDTVIDGENSHDKKLTALEGRTSSNETSISSLDTTVGNLNQSLNNLSTNLTNNYYNRTYIDNNYYTTQSANSLFASSSVYGTDKIYFKGGTPAIYNLPSGSTVYSDLYIYPTKIGLNVFPVSDTYMKNLHFVNDSFSYEGEITYSISSDDRGIVLSSNYQSRHENQVVELALLSDETYANSTESYSVLWKYFSSDDSVGLMPALATRNSASSTTWQYSYLDANLGSAELPWNKVYSNYVETTDIKTNKVNFQHLNGTTYLKSIGKSGNGLCVALKSNSRIVPETNETTVNSALDNPAFVSHTYLGDSTHYWTSLYTRYVETNRIGLNGIVVWHQIVDPVSPIQRPGENAATYCRTYARYKDGSNLFVLNGAHFVPETGRAHSNQTKVYSELDIGTQWDWWRIVYAKTIYTESGTVQKSDRNSKESIQYIEHESDISSDITQDIITAEDILDFVKDVQPVTFNYVPVEDGNISQESIQIGLIAQDIMAHKLYKYIGVYEEWEEEIEPAEYDDDGEEIVSAVVDQGETLALKVLPVAVTALSACKYLLEKIEALEKEVTSLKSIK